MPLPGLYFTAPTAPAPQLSMRADVAVFVGMISRSSRAVPVRLRKLLDDGGWLHNRSEADIAALLGLPVAAESWAEFCNLYTWDQRAADRGSPITLPCPLGLAVHSFFEQGGARAYIVRTGDPIPFLDNAAGADAFAASKRAMLDWLSDAAPPDAEQRVPIIPGLNNPAHMPNPGMRSSWIGAAAIFGIEDAAMLLIPDLIDLCAGQPVPMAPVAVPPPPPELFKPCATASSALEESVTPQAAYRAARLDTSGYAHWAKSIRTLLAMLGLPRGPAHRRDVMLIGSVPLPLAESGYDHGAESNPLCLLGENDAIISGESLMSGSQLGNARLQLAYPWIGTQAARSCPEAVEAPEGVFAGILARSALMQGAFRSAAGESLHNIRFLLPYLGQSDLAQTLPSLAKGAGWLGDRLSLFAERQGRLQLISDATMADSPAWRPGGVSRLMGILLRAARHLGDDLMFEPSGPLTWNALRNQIEALLERLRALEAFSGLTAEECYTVRCDRSTMSQADMDAGRMIAQISFAPAFPVERIVVSLDVAGLPADPMARAA
jgi:uncharacterized protein